MNPQTYPKIPANWMHREENYSSFFVRELEILLKEFSANCYKLLISRKRNQVIETIKNIIQAIVQNNSSFFARYFSHYH